MIGREPHAWRKKWPGSESPASSKGSSHVLGETESLFKENPQSF